MITRLLALTILTGLGASMQMSSAQNAPVEELIQSKKAHRMTIYNGPRRTVHYFPLGKLTLQDVATLRADERMANALPKLTLAVINSGKMDTVEGSIIGTAGDWVIVQRSNGIDRIHKSAIVRIFEPRRREVLPAELGTPQGRRREVLPAGLGTPRGSK